MSLQGKITRGEKWLKLEVIDLSPSQIEDVKAFEASRKTPTKSKEK